MLEQDSQLMMKITRMETQFEGMSTDISEIKSSIREFMQMDRLVTQHGGQILSIQKDVIELDGRIKAFAVDQKADEKWQNFVKGCVAASLVFSGVAIWIAQNTIKKAEDAAPKVEFIAAKEASITENRLLSDKLTVEINKNELQAQRLTSLERLVTIDGIKKATK